MTGATSGATPTEWAHWDLVVGASSDLLPVVCQPGLTLAPTSQLKAYGKVPSRFDREGRVIGFPQWTSHQTTDTELALWSLDARLGICLQTRHLRALDLDLTDAGYVASVLDVLDLLGFTFPIRRRSNSPKCLLLFTLAGEWAKQTLQTPHGVMELLMTGQQCLVAGSHPSGVRYTWDGGLPVTIPVLEAETFDCLRVALASMAGPGAAWSAGRLRHLRVVGPHEGRRTEAAPDAVVSYLLERTPDQVLRVALPDRLDVRCPWAESHTATSDDSATSYFPAKTGGFDQGAFRCLHAHCTDRLTSAYLDAIGYLTDGFEVVGPASDPDADARDASLAAFGLGLTGLSGPDDPDDLVGDLTGGAGAGTRDTTQNPLDLPRFERNKDGSIKPVLQNLVAALMRPDLCGLRLSKDTFTDCLLVGEPGATRPFVDEDYTDLALTLIAKRFGPGGLPTQMLREAVAYVAKQRSFDSAQEWLRSLPPWDGVPRVANFCQTYLGAEPGAYAQAVSRYWWTAHVGRVLVPGIQADMAIVLISTQGTGKTSTIKAMVPNGDMYTELSLSDRDADLCRSMRGKLIGELAELRGIASRDMESVKAWVSCRVDAWTPKYKEFTQALPRRLVLVGTSNQEEFLADETGNRRWLPLLVGDRQDVSGIGRDRELLWAEAHGLFVTDGIQWKEAETLARAEHYQFEIRDPWEDAIHTWLTTPGLTNVKPCDEPFLRSEDILQEALRIDSRHIKMIDQHRIGKILRTLGYRKHVIRVGGRAKKTWMTNERCPIVPHYDYSPKTLP